MSTFHRNPIINSPYTIPTRHWELDNKGQPTQQIVEQRRGVSFITPIPAATPSGRGATQASLNLTLAGEAAGQQQYLSSLINEVRNEVSAWRALPPDRWQVTAATAQLLTYWRSHEFQGLRPFFCQVEAVETAIWLHEVAPHTARGRTWLQHLRAASAEANPNIFRIALKLATGAGKTTVMAMLIAWQTINAVRARNSDRFTTGFLIVTPGITIKDRLRVLLPNDPESYFSTRELVPIELRDEMQRARIVVTNYHAFMLREKNPLASGTRTLLEGHGPAIDTKESPGQMLQRVIPELMSLKRIVVINDEAHHCYRAKQSEEKLTGDDRSTAEENNETARVWISGLEAIQKTLPIVTVYDLSATPFFLRGSGYIEGTLFPWTMSDFSLMDAIECGIVKLPRVPISDNLTTSELPLYRHLWQHIGPAMPKKRRGDERPDPAMLPPQLQTALQVLYGHYEKTYRAWEAAGIPTPPCFIVVCNNTASSRLVYDYISGYEWPNATGGSDVRAGALELFRNYDSHGQPHDSPRTLLIDSAQLESGDALDPTFRSAVSGEIDALRAERVRRSGGHLADAEISDAELLREVMNTVGKPGRLGAGIRCVVSVSMLTEGWDANTVTHILGVRAFSTQLLCEQVIGRALRRQSYELNPETQLFDAEYADVFGIPFDFSTKPTEVVISPPRETVHVHALPERAQHEISFPVVQGYRTELPEDRLVATFTPDSRLVLSAELVGPTKTTDAGIIGATADMDIAHLGDQSFATVCANLTAYLINTRYLDSDNQPRNLLYGQLRPIVREWLERYVTYFDGTHHGLFMYKMLAAQACEKITLAITQTYVNERPIRALLAPFNPTGSTALVNFTSTKHLKHATPEIPARAHLNYHICDSSWEQKLCQILDEHPQVMRYTKNHGMGFVVPYVLAGVPHQYVPDFIAHIDDGHGEHDPLQLVIEVKGYRGADAVVKKQTMETLWVPGVNYLKTHGRWAFVELLDPGTFSGDIDQAVRSAVDSALRRTIARTH